MPDERARRFVAEHFPNARVAILAGSTGTPAEASTSDLDIVIVGDESGPVLRRTDRYADQPIETFVHTGGSLNQFIERETAARRSPLLHMCAEGRLLVDRDGRGLAIQSDARQRLAAGPPPLTRAEHEDRRYLITDLLDDLAGDPEPGELAFVAGRLLPQLAELVLLYDRQWIGSGKWLFRRLHSWSPETADELVGSHRRTIGTGAPAPLHTAATAVLDRCGGRLSAGYLRRSPGTR